MATACPECGGDRRDRGAMAAEVIRLTLLCKLAARGATWRQLSHILGTPVTSLRREYAALTHQEMAYYAATPIGDLIGDDEIGTRTKTSYPVKGNVLRR